MAEDQTGPATASELPPDTIAAVDGAGPSRHVPAEPPRPSVGLPLRQQLKHQPAAPQARVHDITEKFTKASSALNVGQLVKDEFFTLFESIGALEIMDPKMDSGFLQPGEALEDACDTVAPLLPEELIGILDQLLCYEMAWHTGYPLSQTLFTSVYIDRLLWPEPRTLEQAQFYRGPIPDERRPGLMLEVLRSYCLALVKCCDFVIAKITGRDYFEEEDFCTHTYSRVLFTQMPMDVFQRELDAAIERLQDGTEMEIDPTVRDAIIARLNFRKDFLSALDLECSLDFIDRYWPPVIANLDPINTTHQLGKAVPGAFSFKIQRRLASTVPPRPTVELDFSDAFSKLKQLCTDGEEAVRVMSLDPDPLEYQSFLWAFASRKPTPLPYSRSYLCTLLFQESSVSIPLSDLKSLVFPCSTILDPSNWALSPPRNPMMPKPHRLRLAHLIDEFVERAGQAYLDFWTALGQNRCRLRRMLNHVIIGWDQLQHDAGFVDDDLMRVVGEMGIQDQVIPFPLTTWTYHKKLWMIEKIVLLGFEQDIYLPDEYAGMYLFLSSVSRRRNALLQTVLDHFHDRRSALLHSDAHADAQEVQDGAQYITSLLHEASGIRDLSLALSGFYTTLLYLRLIPRPTRPFSTPQLRDELRMKPFLTLTPQEMFPFPDLQAQILPYGAYDAPDSRLWEDLRGEEYWRDIEGHIKGAKEAFAQVKKLGAKAARAGGVEGAWGKEVQGVLASCVALGVEVAGVRRAVGWGEGGEGEVRTKVKVEIPGEGGRYSGGWVVGRVGRL
ncbi:Mak10-domain-containing protein [Polyplosphaeria fusca]|uniref:Mak10-domain-containing protein n=1 Tax=Polyplosphaeria fusca TaxID=682080 RepID=A0A9P4QPS3_9PLEO|nr:Mak10-domain-containing protein [Polyplosphaeria fusca]